MMFSSRNKFYGNSVLRKTISQKVLHYEYNYQNCVVQQPAAEEKYQHTKKNKLPSWGISMIENILFRSK